MFLLYLYLKEDNIDVNIDEMFNLTPRYEQIKKTQFDLLSAEEKQYCKIVQTDYLVDLYIIERNILFMILDNKFLKKGTYFYFSSFNEEEKEYYKKYKKDKE